MRGKFVVALTRVLIALIGFMPPSIVPAIPDSVTGIFIP